ncbi:succinyl-diaminopimelate desuccinylase [Zooshikella ganghwensis]|uniref:Succinyl-diaminopimelate desuccinylase n=1 Tax=Zooshikella ganghwensis TaxID=202772 RepID=A0A4P9VNL6_9GAMM|nr:succinyl-diaminopimelate desuccinylase [Zooshikella ganghwensis]RDH45048.1 succinyl-diaminopimelate desuccinylase [Zooshikella ganghwensis]
MTTTSPTLALACDLIARPSITPEDADCQTLLISRLQPLGFHVERLRFGEVENIWLRKGNGGPVLAFAGHTDVVPTGPKEEWHTPPFTPTIKDDYLYGRGAADMKGSLAAMVTATERFLNAYPNHQGSLAWLITSDEEGPAVNGTRKVMEYLSDRNDYIDWCIVGEPSSTAHVGDVIKNGRRGSLTGELTIRGIQGHVAYPHLVKNPIHLAAPALAALSTTQWDKGNDFFPATSFQISNIHAGTGAGNVVPGELQVMFNFRFSTESSAEELQARTHHILQQHHLDYHIDWTLFGSPFLTERGRLIDAAQAAIHAEVGTHSTLSTSGGTSDGRFIAPYGTEVIELGPCNDTIHKVNECTRISELETLSSIYERIMINLLG